MELGGPQPPTRACLLPAPGPTVSGRGSTPGRPRAASGLVLSGPRCPLNAAGSAVGVRGRGLSIADVLTDSAGREGAGGGALGWAGRSRGGGSWSCCSRWDLRVGMGWASVHPISSFLLPQIFALPPGLGFLSSPGAGNLDAGLILGLQFPTFASSGSVLGSLISPGPRGVVFSAPGLGDECVDAGDLLQSSSSRPA